MVRADLTEEITEAVTFEQRPERGREGAIGISEVKTFQAERTTSAKALWWKMSQRNSKEADRHS